MTPRFSSQRLRKPSLSQPHGNGRPSLHPAGLPSPTLNGTLPLSAQPDPDEVEAAEYEIVERRPDQRMPPTRADQFHKTEQHKEPLTFSPPFPEPPSHCLSGGGDKRKAISPSPSQLSKASRGPDLDRLIPAVTFTGKEMEGTGWESIVAPKQ